MKIELDKIKLVTKSTNTQTRVTQETRSVYNINTAEKRTLVEHKIPGLEGNLFQDMGREPIRISFDGMLQGPLAKKNLEELRKKFKAGKPIQFASDITGTTDVTKVLIEDLVISDTLGDSTRFTYSLALMEYIEAKTSSSGGASQQQTPAPSQEKEAEEKVGKVINEVLKTAKEVKETAKEVKETAKKVKETAKKVKETAKKVKDIF